MAARTDRSGRRRNRRISRYCFLPFGRTRSGAIGGEGTAISDAHPQFAAGGRAERRPPHRRFERRRARHQRISFHQGGKEKGSADGCCQQEQEMATIAAMYQQEFVSCGWPRSPRRRVPRPAGPRRSGADQDQPTVSPVITTEMRPTDALSDVDRVALHSEVARCRKPTPDNRYGARTEVPVHAYARSTVLARRPRNPRSFNRPNLLKS